MPFPLDLTEPRRPPGQQLSGLADPHPTLAGPGLQLALASLITVLAWPILVKVRAVPGVDGPGRSLSTWRPWMDLRQGVDIVFTYGPLGFLSIPQPHLGATSLLAPTSPRPATHFGLVAILLLEARRALPLRAAALVFLVIARTFAMLPPPQRSRLFSSIVCVEALAGRSGSRHRASSR